jgi:uncharacterized membrane protein YccC
LQANRFVKWSTRCASIELIIGTLVGVVFGLLATSAKPFPLIPLDVVFALLLGCVFWPVASRVRIHPQSRFVRIIEGTLHGAIIGAIMLMPFSEGFGWATVQAIEGALLGGFLGTIFAAVMRWKTPTTSVETTARA